MHKRTTPKIFRGAKELHRNMSPAEAKLWQHLRAHQMGDVHFRNHTVPAGGAGDTPLGTILSTFVRHERNSSSSWMAASIWSSRNMTRNVQSISKRVAIGCCGFGTMT
jgi:hypothetical protein